MLHLFHHTSVELCFRAAFLAVVFLPFAGLARVERKERRRLLQLSDALKRADAPSVAYRPLPARLYASRDHPVSL